MASARFVKEVSPKELSKEVADAISDGVYDDDGGYTTFDLEDEIDGHIHKADNKRRDNMRQYIDRIAKFEIETNLSDNDRVRAIQRIKDLQREIEREDSERIYDDDRQMTRSEVFHDGYNGVGQSTSRKNEAAEILRDRAVRIATAKTRLGLAPNVPDIRQVVPVEYINKTGIISKKVNETYSGTLFGEVTDIPYGVVMTSYAFNRPDYEYIVALQIAEQRYKDFGVLDANSKERDKIAALAIEHNIQVKDLDIQKRMHEIRMWIDDRKEELLRNMEKGGARESDSLPTQAPEPEPTSPTQESSMNEQAQDTPVNKQTQEAPILADTTPGSESETEREREDVPLLNGDAYPGDNAEDLAIAQAYEELDRIRRERELTAGEQERYIEPEPEVYQSTLPNGRSVAEELAGDYPLSQAAIDGIEWGDTNFHGQTIADVRLQRMFEEGLKQLREEMIEQQISITYREQQETLTSWIALHIEKEVLEAAQGKLADQVRAVLEAQKVQEEQQRESGKAEPIKAPEAPKQEPIKAPETPKQEPIKAPETPKQEPIKAPETPKQEPIKAPETPKQEPIKAPETPKQEQPQVATPAQPTPAQDAPGSYPRAKDRERPATETNSPYMTHPGWKGMDPEKAKRMAVKGLTDGAAEQQRQIEAKFDATKREIESANQRHMQDIAKQIQDGTPSPDPKISGHVGRNGHGDNVCVVNDENGKIRAWGVYGDDGKPLMTRGDEDWQKALTEAASRDLKAREERQQKAEAQPKKDEPEHEAGQSNDERFMTI